MCKLTTLILVALSLVACGGEPFGATSTDIEQIGGADSAAGAGEAGSLGTGDAGASYGGTASGGSSSAAAGNPSGGSAPQAGSGGSGAGTGGAQATCSLDETKLTAALPESFVWESFVYTNNEFCGRCRDTPCDTINVISWGSPTVDDGGGYVYSPNADAPMVSMALGANDGVCASETTCGVKLRLGSIRIIVEQGARGWVVTDVTAYPSGEGNACLSAHPGGGSLHNVATADFGKEVEAALIGLELPCG